MNKHAAKKISLVQCSEWVRHASLVLFIAAASVGVSVSMVPFLSQAASNCDPQQPALNTLQCAGQQFYGPGEPKSVIAVISAAIGVFLGILGILFVVLLLYGGFLWMTARGDDKQVKKAQDMITQAVIGIAIILSAWAIGYFVINNLVGVVTSSH